MAGWLPFSVLAVVLTVVLLFLARQSQELIEESIESRSSETSPAKPVDSDTDEAAGESELSAVSEQESGELSATSGQKSSELTTTPGQESSELSGGAGQESAELSTAPGQESSAQSGAAGTGPSEPPHRSRGAEQLELTPATLLANVAVTQGLVAVIVLAAAWYFSIPAEAFGVTAEATSTGIPAIVGGVVFGVVLWVGNEFSTTIADAVGAAYDERMREMLAPESPGGWAVMFLLVLPIIAIAEELLFRAALIGVPAAGFDISPWLLAVFASVAFALGHGAQGRVGIIVTGLLGFVLAAGYIVSGSLLLVIVAHYVINALEFFLHEYLDLDLLDSAIGTG